MIELEEVTVIFGKVSVVIVKVFSVVSRSEEYVHDTLGVVFAVDVKFVTEWFVVEILLPCVNRKRFTFFVRIDVNSVIDVVFFVIEVSNEFVDFDLAEGYTAEFELVFAVVWQVALVSVGRIFFSNISYKSLI